MAKLYEDWRPNWWNDQHASAWDRVKEALRRDWEQTKHDLSKKRGHELNQDVGDTVQQAAGKAAIPAADGPVPPTVKGNADWDVVEEPMRYGFAARTRYGADHPSWDADVDRRLRGEWEAVREHGARGWEDVREHVRRGYEYRH